MKGDVIENFKIVNEISNFGRHSLKISPSVGNLLSRQISKTKSINQLYIFANILTYFWNKLDCKQQYYKTF